MKASKAAPPLPQQADIDTGRAAEKEGSQESASPAKNIPSTSPLATSPQKTSIVERSISEQVDTNNNNKDLLSILPEKESLEAAPSDSDKHASKNTELSHRIMKMRPSHTEEYEDQLEAIASAAQILSGIEQTAKAEELETQNLVTEIFEKKITWIYGKMEINKKNPKIDLIVDALQGRTLKELQSFFSSCTSNSKKWSLIKQVIKRLNIPSTSINALLKKNKKQSFTIQLITLLTALRCKDTNTLASPQVNLSKWKKEFELRTKDKPYLEEEPNIAVQFSTDITRDQPFRILDHNNETLFDIRKHTHNLEEIDQESRNKELLNTGCKLLKGIVTTLPDHEKEKTLKALSFFATQSSGNAIYPVLHDLFCDSETTLIPKNSYKNLDIKKDGDVHQLSYTFGFSDYILQFNDEFFHIDQSVSAEVQATINPSKTPAWDVTDFSIDIAPPKKIKLSES